MRAALVATFLAVGVASGAPAAVPTPRAPALWVDDARGFLSPEARGRLDAKLEAYQRATGHEVVVWIGDTIGGASLDEFATRAFAAWQLGRKGHDDGVALFVLPADRRIAIEVGYGLEGQLTDLASKHVIDDVMAPRLARGDRDGAIELGVVAILGAIEGHPWNEDTAVTHPPSGTSSFEAVLGALALIGIAIFAVLHPRAFFWLLAMTIGRGLGNLGGGGSHGRGGGGGGRSGGGGARGGW